MTMQLLHHTFWLYVHDTIKKCDYFQVRGHLCKTLFIINSAESTYSSGACHFVISESHAEGNVGKQSFPVKHYLTVTISSTVTNQK